MMLAKLEEAVAEAKRPLANGHDTIEAHAT
jgi:hypothetical protein